MTKENALATIIANKGGDAMAKCVVCDKEFGLFEGGSKCRICGKFVHDKSTCSKDSVCKLCLYKIGKK